MEFIDAAGESIEEYLKVLDNYDRPFTTSADLFYAEKKAYITPGFNKTGLHLPRAAAYGAAGVLRAKAEYSVFEAEAKGPNVSAEVSASVKEFKAIAGAETASASVSTGPIKQKIAGPNASAEISLSPETFKAMASAEIVSASVSAGPIKAKIGLGVNTGVKIDASKMELQVLGTGFNIGPHSSVSVLGNEVECPVM